MRTLQRKLKFSNGEINEKLLERTDLDLLSSSASFLENFVSTPYGSIKTRDGTKFIGEVGSFLIEEDPDTITSYVGGTTSDLLDSNIFTTNGLEFPTLLVMFDMATIDTRSNFSLSDIKLDYSPAIITLTETAGVITGYTIVDGGIGLHGAVIAVIDPTGINADISNTTDSKGTITGLTIVNGGTGYTDPTATTSSDSLDMDIYVEISDDDITYALVDTYSVNITSKSFSTNILTDYRYIRLRGGGLKTRLLIDKMTVANSVAGSSTAKIKAKIIPFYFNDNQKYVLVLKNETIDIYQDDSFLETISAPDLKEDYFSTIKYTQNEDTIILTHPDMTPKEIKRTGLDAQVSILPTFEAGETSKSGFDIAGDGTGEYKAVDGDDSTFYSEGDFNESKILTQQSDIPTTHDSVLTDTYLVDFPTGQAITKISLDLEEMKSFVLYGKESGGSYTVIKTDNANVNKKRTVVVEINDTYYGLKLEMVGYKYLNSTGGFGNKDLVSIPPFPSIFIKPSYGGGSSFPQYYFNTTHWKAPRVYNIKVITTTTQVFNFSSFDYVGNPYYAFDGEVKTPKTIGITPSDIEGSGSMTADSAVFTTDSVGQKIDGNGGIFKITEYKTSTKVNGYTIIPFYTAGKITDWDLITGYERVWSDTRGYPTTCLFYQQRLWFGGSKTRPNTLWGSRISAYNDFSNVGNYANDGIEATLSSSSIDGIVNLYANRGLQIFTRGSEYVATEGSLTPDDITIIKNTSNGSLDKVSPVDISGTTLFLEKNGKNLLSFVYTDTQASFITTNISLLTTLISNPTSMAFDYNSVRQDGNYLYIVKDDGTVAVACILLDQKINSYVRMKTNGLFSDVAVVGDDVFFLVQRGTELYLEKLFNVKTDNTLIKQPVQVITGLDIFNGDDVYVYTDTQSYGEFTVSSGQIDIGEVPTETLYIGHGYTYNLVSNKSYVGKNIENIDKRISKMVVVTNNTPQLEINGDLRYSTYDRYTFNTVTRFDRDVRFSISGEFERVEILSMSIYINYGVK